MFFWQAVQTESVWTASGIFFYARWHLCLEPFHVAGARKLTEENVKPVMKWLSSHYKHQGQGEKLINYEMCFEDSLCAMDWAGPRDKEATGQMCSLVSQGLRASRGVEHQLELKCDESWGDGLRCLWQGTSSREGSQRSFSGKEV